MNNLKFTRKSRRLTQKELAHLLHMSTSTYIKKEKNLDYFRVDVYKRQSLAMTKDLGYKTVFWSFAYGDYEPSNQPSLYEGKKNILDHLHDGSILLLHAISKTNADILGEVIDEARKSGYEFYLLP